MRKPASGLLEIPSDCFLPHGFLMYNPTVLSKVTFANKCQRTQKAFERALTRVDGNMGLEVPLLLERITTSRAHEFAGYLCVLDDDVPPTISDALEALSALWTDMRF
mmetsp:Transcript_18676/g.46897  ORF Transcript_18676/g.46897 Transcript_18676/m.46897 type:complete len:107 (+) Transcript_18676:249-569(+)